MPASATAADRNLLFGILAVQMNFISKDALINAMNAWVLDKQKPLGQILLDQKALAADTHQLLDALVQKHLDRRQRLGFVPGHLSSDRARSRMYRCLRARQGTNARSEAGEGIALALAGRWFTIAFILAF